MGTRRLRLYVAVYLRGLLSPYYEQGTLSVVREELLLNAVSSELDANMTEQLLHVQAAMASHVRDKRSYFNTLFDKVLDYRNKLEFEKPLSPKVEEDSPEEEGALTGDVETDKLIRRAREMKESGEWDTMEAEMAAELKEMDEEVQSNALRNPDGSGISYGSSKK